MADAFPFDVTCEIETEGSCQAFFLTVFDCLVNFGKEVLHESGDVRKECFRLFNSCFLYVALLATSSKVKTRLLATLGCVRANIEPAQVAMREVYAIGQVTKRKSFFDFVVLGGQDFLHERKIPKKQRSATKKNKKRIKYYALCA